MKTTFFILSLLLTTPLFPQEFVYQRQITPFPVRDLNGAPYIQALTGGMNRPVHQFVDIDGDADADLFVQDRAQQLTFFRNTGTPANHQFEWVTDQFENLTVGEWFKFADVDRDGDVDLFAENPFGIFRYYRNDGSAMNPNFVLVTDTLKDVDNNPIIADGLSIPDWADIDCDNDLELFLGRALMGTITLYEFVGLDANAVPLYRLETDFYQDIIILTGAAKTQKIDNEANNERHGANSLTLVDVDGDRDNDIFWGDFFADGLIFLENFGTCENAVFDTSRIVERFPPNEPVATGGYNVPRFADIDSDGDPDMFVGVLGGAISFVRDVAENLYFYENTGDSINWNYNRQTKQFIESVDIGRNTNLTFGDIDNDTDLDLFLANEIDLAAPNQTNSRLHFYENTGSNTNPDFRLIDTHYLNFDQAFFGSNYAPAFADLDNDNDFDLYLGNWDGKIVFFRNDGNAQSPDFVMVTEVFGALDVGNNSTPDFTDIDDDGDLDLFIGEFSGNINFYRNDGDAGNAVFVLDTTHYFGINLGPTEYSHPKFIDIDEDGDQDLFIGSDTKGIVFYRNNGDPRNANFQLDNSFQLPLHLRAAPEFVDIDADSDLDFFSGVSGGGFVFYENRKVLVGIDPQPPQATVPTTIHLLKNYPNPFNPSTTIEYELALSGDLLGSNHTLNIYNMLGQLVRSWNFLNAQTNIQNSIIWDGRNQAGVNVQSGIYFYELTAGTQTSLTGKMLLVR